MKQILAVAMIFSAAASLAAAETPAPKAPLEKSVAGATTPERVIRDLEAAAKRRQDSGTPASRGFNWRVALPDNAGEFAALRGYGVFLLTVLTKKAEELPVKRLYIQAGGQELALQKLSSWRSDVDSKLLAYDVYGPYREDGFYLVPFAPLTREGTMLADLAVEKMLLRLVQLPSPNAVERSKKFATPDPAPGAKPEPRTLKAFFQKKFTGFPPP
jgi:hypothetical protein